LICLSSLGEEVLSFDELWKALRKKTRCIDQIVYRLYGLSDEEIRLVEGRGTKDLIR
jgi:hypothetical protein